MKIIKVEKFFGIFDLLKSSFVIFGFNFCAFSVFVGLEICEIFSYGNEENFDDFHIKIENLSEKHQKNDFTGF